MLLTDNGTVGRRWLGMGTGDEDNKDGGTKRIKMEGQRNEAKGKNGV